MLLKLIILIYYHMVFKMLIIIKKLKESPEDEYQKLEQQIDHFEEVMADDGEEIALRFKEGQVDISVCSPFIYSIRPSSTI